MSRRHPGKENNFGLSSEESRSEVLVTGHEREHGTAGGSSCRALSWICGSGPMHMETLAESPRYVFPAYQLPRGPREVNVMLCMYACIYVCPAASYSGVFVDDWLG